MVADLRKEEEFKSIILKFKPVSIGPITTDTAVELGLTPQITADEYTIDGLVDSILKLYKN